MNTKTVVDVLASTKRDEGRQEKRPRCSKPETCGFYDIVELLLGPNISAEEEEG